MSTIFPMMVMEQLKRVVHSFGFTRGRYTYNTVFVAMRDSKTIILDGLISATFFGWSRNVSIINVDHTSKFSAIVAQNEMVKNFVNDCEKS